MVWLPRGDVFAVEGWLKTTEKCWMEQKTPLKTGMTSWKITGFNINTSSFMVLFLFVMLVFGSVGFLQSLGDTSTQSAPMVVFSKHPRSERFTAPKNK